VEVPRRPASQTSRPSQPVQDARILRAIAHPERNRILAELAAAGPLRAADVTRLLGIPANQASFHLRQLAKYGVVEPAPDLARDGRDRVWRLVAEEGYSLSPAEIEQQPGGKAAVAVWQRSAAAEALTAVDAAFSLRREKGTHTSVLQHSVKLTKDEAAELSAQLDALLQEWTRRTRGQDPSRRTYQSLTVLQPHPGDDPA